MKAFQTTGAFALLLAAAAGARSQDGQILVVSASNAATSATSNQLLVYDTNAKLVQTIATQGKGGVSGNAGGIAADRNQLAAVNFGSNSVSLFERTGNGFALRQVI